MFICIYINKCICTDVHMRICSTYVLMYARMYAYGYVLSVYMQKYMYVNMYMCLLIYFFF